MVWLVCGSPCSGKTTYINEHMGDGDIVCDVDLIYGAISGNDPHDADLWVHEVALQLKERLLEIIKNREGGWKDAYVVSVANTKSSLEADIARCRADKTVFMDTPYEVCMERAKERPEMFRHLVSEWFQTKEEEWLSF